MLNHEIYFQFPSEISISIWFMLTQYENLTLMLQTANCQKLEDYHAEIVVAIPETADISEQQI